MQGNFRGLNGWTSGQDYAKAANYIISSAVAIKLAMNLGKLGLAATIVGLVTGLVTLAFDIYDEIEENKHPSKPINPPSIFPGSVDVRIENLSDKSFKNPTFAITSEAVQANPPMEIKAGEMVNFTITYAADKSWWHFYLEYDVDNDETSSFKVCFLVDLTKKGNHIGMNEDCSTGEQPQWHENEVFSYDNGTKMFISEGADPVALYRFT